MSKPRTEDAVLADLALVQSIIETHRESLDEAMTRRSELLAEARGLVPPVTHRRLAAICGDVTEVAIIRALGTRRAKQAAG